MAVAPGAGPETRAARRPRQAHRRAHGEIKSEEAPGLFLGRPYSLFQALKAEVLKLVPGSVQSGKLLEMQIPGSYPRPPESGTLGVAPAKV